MLDEKNILGMYIEIDGVPVPEPDSIKWGQWFEAADRIVAKTIVGSWEISTVFLGLDHNFLRTGPPLLYETMIFSTTEKGYSAIFDRFYAKTADEQWRYPTREMALVHHRELVAGAKEERLDA